LRLAAHGIALELPAGWEGRIIRRAGGEPLLHAASFPLPPRDGDFGSGATAAMPPGGALLVLKEYRPGPRLQPGGGLFAASGLPLPLREGQLNPRALQVTRPHQRGLQHFFTRNRRPFCLYVVVADAPPAGAAAARAAPTTSLRSCTQALQSLHIAGEEQR
jgi:hypothetical protein